jgi:hypothetical protein
VDQNTFIVAVGAVNGLFLLGALQIWLRYRERRAMHKPPQDERLVAEIQELRGSIETIAVEVERLGEGQRFVARALAERGALPPTPRAAQERVITPH